MTGIVTVVSGGRRVSGWQTVEITRSLERFPSTFHLTLADTGSVTQTLSEGDDCRVYLDGDLVCTGTIDTIGGAFSDGQHAISVSGRSLCRQLHDCSAIRSAPATGAPLTAANAADILEGAYLGGTTILTAAQALAAPWPEIQVRQLVSDADAVIPQFPISLGAKPYQLIEEMARWQGLLVYDDVDGALILNRVSTDRMASGFTQGVNVKSASWERSEAQRYSDIMVVWQAVDQSRDVQGNSPLHGFAHDQDVSSFRPLIVISEQFINGQDIAQLRAIWEKNRRYGRSRSVRVRVPGWRDTAGSLWAPNYLARVNIPTARLTAVDWTIAEVTYRLDRQSGEIADITLMPPEAFSIEPSIPPQVDPDVQQAMGSGASNQDSTPQGTPQPTRASNNQGASAPQQTDFGKGSGSTFA